MGEPTCLMQVQPFSYASGLPNEANEGNPIHALGQSVSFGRFTSESLAWEKWSTFSNNRYVEEAERFSQPGSVAQKKAFFEAHYKNLAARKAAAAAAALLEKENAAASANTAPDKPDPTQDSKTTVSNFEAVVDELGQKIFVVNGNGHRPNVEKIENFDSRKVEVTDVVTGVEVSSHVENQEEKVRELSETAKLEKSISKPEREVSKKKITLSSTKSSTKSAAPTATPLNKRLALEPTDQKRSTPKTFHKAINFTPIRELNRITSSVIRKIENSRVGGSSSKANKDISTPLRTPNTVSKNGARQQTLNTPFSANRRAVTPVDPPTSGTKPSGPKWRLLPTDCSKFLSGCRKKTRSPFSSTPFSLRTEERAARRQEKLEEKFNANEAITEQLQAKVKDKPETAAGKLNPSLCFKARPLPDFYKQRKPQKNEIKKVPVTRPQSPNLRSKPTPTKVEKRTSQTPNKPPVKNNVSKQIQGKNARSPTCSLISRPTRMTTITHENRSPNIQQG